jgi:DUF971 family protein
MTDNQRKTPLTLSTLGPQADEFRPIDLNLDRKEGLRITWADNHKSVFPLTFLRKNCPCATCRETHGPAPVVSGTSLTILPANISKATEFADARLVGNYAIQITWGDGHSTGIFDFRMLRLLDADGA